MAIVMSLFIILFGLIGFTYLGIREYPNIDPPVITVSTSYAGANADVIESQITEPLEESISGIAGIRSLSSASREGSSSITVEFNLGVDLEAASNDVRDRVSRARRNLPPDCDPPIVIKADANASPILWLNIKSDTRDLLELTDISTNILREKLRTIEGVSDVQVWGAKEYAMRLWIDPAKLSAYKLTPLDIQTALARENVELPSGRIEGSLSELTIRTMGRLVSAEDFNNLIIKEAGGNIIRFRDIGHAELGASNYRTLFQRDGIPMNSVVLIPQPGANHISIIDEFYQRMEQFKKDLPADVDMAIGFDASIHIRNSINEVEETIISAFILVLLIIFLFLRDWRTTLIPIVAIPVSLIGAFFIMYIANFSINVLTLLGVVLAIGMVVDDAIVVLENIYTKIEKGMEPIRASLLGTKEVYFAIISTTVSLAAVFLPIIFLQGLTGRLFREFGIVLAGSIIISAFVSLTLTPMMGSRILKQRQKHSRFYYLTEPYFERLSNGYRRWLYAFMNKRWLAMAAMLVSIFITFVIFTNLPRELAPYEDRSGLRINATAPEGANFEYMYGYMSDLTNLVLEFVHETEALNTMTSPGFSGSGVNSGFVRITLVEPDNRVRSQQAIADALATKLTQLTGARTYIAQEQSLGSGGARGALPVQYVLQAPDIDQLKTILPPFLEEAKAHPVFNFVGTNLKFNKPELRVRIDRERARTLGVATIDIAQSLQLAYSGQRSGYFIRNSKQYQIIAQVERPKRSEPLDLKTLYVRNKTGDLVQLDNLVTLEESSSPPQLYRYNRYISATIMAGLAPGKTIGDGIAAMDEIADKVLDESFRTDLAGASRDFAESSSSLLFAFALALVLIYLILSAQFESFRDPFIIMFTVPLALAGALISLWYFNQSLNIFSQIGMIMLIGLVTKNGILIVEFANQRRAQGLPLIEAIENAAVSRLRPILMTSMSTFLGILPIALAFGAGSESRIPMGIAVCGGLLFSTFLTLFIIPAVYTYFSKERQSFSHVTDHDIEVEEKAVV